MAEILEITRSLRSYTLNSAGASGIFPAHQGNIFHAVVVTTLINDFMTLLRNNASATAALEQWCESRLQAFGSPAQARVIAECDRLATKPLNAVSRARLEVSPTEPINFRHVRLCCLGRTLLEADNWYVPSRLTQAMNYSLETTDMPFGRVVRTLNFNRTILNSNRLLSTHATDPTNRDQQQARREQNIDSETVVEDQALIRRSDGVVISFVIESYKHDLLTFPLSAA
jgi:hypothetical protein